MSTARKYLLIFGGVLLLSSALSLVRFYSQPTDIWWTPKPLALPLSDASDRVQVFVRDVALSDHLKADRLRLLTVSGATPVTDADVRLRLNNRDRIRAGGVPTVLTAGVALGASAVLLLFGLMGWVPSDPRKTVADGRRD